MILVDTSVWIAHLRAADFRLITLLAGGQVLTHPFVVGELAMGNLAQRDLVLASLRDLPAAIRAEDDEVLDLVRREGLHGLGVGYVDAHLLAAARLTLGARLWTYDQRLKAVAQRLDVADIA